MSLGSVIVVYPRNNGTELHDSTWCAWLGFITNWSGWSEYLFYLVIILCLLMIVCVQFKGSALQTQRRFRILFEAIVVPLCVFLPGLVLWVPMYSTHLKYGLDEGYCLFKIESDKSKDFYRYIFFFNTIIF